MAPADSKSGTNSSSYKSRGIFPTNTWARTRAGKSHRPKKKFLSKQWQNPVHLSSNSWVCSCEHNVRRWTSIFSLTCSDIQGVTCPLQQGLKKRRVLMKTSPQAAHKARIITLNSDHKLLITFPVFYLYFCLVWALVGLLHLTPLLFPLSISLHNSTEKSAFVLHKTTGIVIVNSSERHRNSTRRQQAV